MRRLLIAMAILAGSTAQALEFGPGWNASIPCRSDSTQTYTLYLPSAYATDRTWPVLLVFDPRGRSRFAAEIFSDAAEKFGWILVSSNNTQSDGPWEPNARALRALWPEVHARFAADPKRIYAAGFSGGAIVAWYLAQFATPPLAGIIACGGRPADEIPTDTIRFAHFGAAGETDFNYSEMKLLDAVVANRGMPHQFRAFEGGHAWMPHELAAEAVEWMDVLAMRSGLRPVDAEVVTAALARNMSRASTLAAGGKELEALRCYEMIATTWDGLLDLSSVREAVNALAKSSAVATQREGERRADVFEEQAKARLAAPLGRLEEGVAYELWQDIAEEMDLRALKRQAEAATPEGGAARRVLAWAFGRTHFYIPREQMSRPVARATALRIAAEIRPHDAEVWRRLAIALALCGKEEEACTAIRRAVDAGYRDLAALERDKDLDRALARKDCAATIARLKASAPSAPR